MKKLKKQIINLAKKSGLSAVKLQTYTPETMTINSRRKDFLVKNGIWKGLPLIYIKKHKHLLNGKKNYLIMQKKLALNALALLLI